MLFETEKILTQFRELNQKTFYKTAIAIRPWDQSQNETSFGTFNEASNIYALMYTLSLMVDTQLFIGNFDIEYTSPIEVVNLLKELKEDILSNITSLKKVNDKYDKSFYPVQVTLDSYKKLLVNIEFILKLPEVVNIIGDPIKEQIIKDIIFYKSQRLFKFKQFKIIKAFIIYLFTFILPLVIILFFSESHKKESWYVFLLFLLPITNFLFERNSFLEVFKFVTSKKYRDLSKDNIVNEVRSEYFGIL